MRALLKHLLAKHPVVAAIAVAVRWLTWLAIGHPAAIFVAIATITIGVPLFLAVPLALAIDIPLTTRMVDPPALNRSWRWAQAARFRRAWPSATAALVRGGARTTVLSTNHYSSPGGYRPMLEAPPLSFFPRFNSVGEATWVVRPTATLPYLRLRTETFRIGARFDSVSIVRILPYESATWDENDTRARLVVSFQPSSGSPSGSNHPSVY